MRFSFTEWNLVTGNEDVTLPRFQCETVNTCMTSKTHNFPNLYPLQYPQVKRNERPVRLYTVLEKMKRLKNLDVWTEGTNR